MEKIFETVIIGGGASGLFCSALLNNKQDVLVIAKNAFHDRRVAAFASRRIARSVLQVARLDDDVDRRSGSVEEREKNVEKSFAGDRRDRDGDAGAAFRVDVTVETPTFFRDNRQIEGGANRVG